eukprot:gene9583-19918_t
MVSVTAAIHHCNGRFRYADKLKSKIYSIITTYLSSTRTYVFNGDVTLPNVFQNPSFKKFQADILVTDPPYCLLTRRRRNGDLRDSKIYPRKRRLEDHDTVPRFENLKHYKQFTESWMQNCIQYIMKPQANMIIWTNPLGKQIIQDCASFHEYNYIGEYIWAKTTSNATINNNSIKNEVLLRICETALIFTHKSNISPIPDNIPWSVISGYKDNNDDNSLHPHPCHKPSKVLEPLLRTWTTSSSAIFDPFAGSGSILSTAVTTIGCKEVLGVELLEEWTKKSNRSVVEALYPENNVV